MFYCMILNMLIKNYTIHTFQQGQRSTVNLKVTGPYLKPFLCTLNYTDIFD